MSSKNAYFTGKCEEVALKIHIKRDELIPKMLDEYEKPLESWICRGRDANQMKMDFREQSRREESFLTLGSGASSTPELSLPCVVGWKNSQSTKQLGLAHTVLYEPSNELVSDMNGFSYGGGPFSEDFDPFRDPTTGKIVLRNPRDPSLPPLVFDTHYACRKPITYVRDHVACSAYVTPELIGSGATAQVFSCVSSPSQFRFLTAWACFSSVWFP